MVKTTMQGINGEILEDTSSTGRVRPWREYKLGTELLAMAYDSINPRKAVRLRDCAAWLGFARVDGDGGGKRLVEANFCRVRLCPMCQWRRALKSYKYTRQIVSAMITHYREVEGVNLRWLMVTLTVKSCTGPQLDGTLDQLQDAWRRLRDVKAMEPVIGWYRALEVTHDCNEYITDVMYKSRQAYYDKRGLKSGDCNPNYDTYHPHYHVLIAVSDTYARISYAQIRKTWQDAWQSAARLSYVPQVDVRRSYRRGQVSSADDVAAMVAEAAKYTCKSGDYLRPDDWDLTLDTVRLLDKALDGRRFSAYGKACRDWHRMLNLDDVDSDSADLVGADEDGMDKLEPSIIYAWVTGYKQYISE